MGGSRSHVEDPVRRRPATCGGRRSEPAPHRSQVGPIDARIAIKVTVAVDAPGCTTRWVDLPNTASPGCDADQARIARDVHVANAYHRQTISEPLPGVSRVGAPVDAQVSSGINGIVSCVTWVKAHDLDRHIRKILARTIAMKR